MSQGDFNPEQFNWGDHASDGDGFRLLPPGDYFADVHSFKRTRDRGKHQLDLTIEVCGSVDNRSEESARVWETLTIASNAIWRLADLCKAVGAPTTFNLNSDADVAKAIKGQLMIVTLRTDEWGGKKRNKVDRYRAMTSAEEKIADELNLYGENDGADPDSGGGDTFSEDDIPF
jgi:hypothetical protein